MMLELVRRNLSFANVTSVMALFIALGGSAYAVTQIDRNSVKSKHIVDGQVKSSDVEDDGLTGADVDESTFGSLARVGEWQEVGGENEPAFGVSHDCSWGDNDLEHFNTAGFMREGSIVRLKGRVGITETAETSGCRDSHTGQTGRTPEIFNLPPGYRPARTELQLAIANGDPSPLRIEPNGSVRYIGSYTGEDGAFFGVWLDGVAFRCAPAGQNGCP